MSIDQLKEYFLSKAEYPFVLRGLLDDWPAAKWTPRKLAELLGDQRIRFRIGRKHEDDVQWETECCYEEATISHFTDWNSGTCCHDNPLAGYDKKEYWCYADYKYMVEIFSGKPDILKAVQWQSLGFAGRSGEESTFWLGSESSYTVCHYDTYGCNLVAQIYGRKKWVLFSPADNKALYPTRIPYEESSVFSEVNVIKPDLDRHPAYRRAVPYQVILEPGDVLFVPRQWWHFVQSLDTTISINTWIELDCDNESRLHEAITRLLACSLMSHSKRDDQLQRAWLNPTETVTEFSQNMTYIRQAFSRLDLSSVTVTDTHEDLNEDNLKLKPGNTEHDTDDDPPAGETATKVPRLAKESLQTLKHPHPDQTQTDMLSESGVNTDDHFPGFKAPSHVWPPASSEPPILSEEFEKKHVVRIKPNTGDILCTKPLSHVKDQEITDQHVINSILHPAVIQTICRHLLTKK